jgi:hypothetical protein
MPTVTCSAVIAEERAAVFALVSTAKHWPRSRPATEGVSGQIQQPMALGDRVTRRALAPADRSRHRPAQACGRGMPRASSPGHGAQGRRYS